MVFVIEFLGCVVVMCLFCFSCTAEPIITLFVPFGSRSEVSCVMNINYSCLVLPNMSSRTNMAVIWTESTPGKFETSKSLRLSHYLPNIVAVYANLSMMNGKTSWWISIYFRSYLVFRFGRKKLICRLCCTAAGYRCKNIKIKLSTF